MYFPDRRTKGVKNEEVRGNRAEETVRDYQRKNFFLFFIYKKILSTFPEIDPTPHDFAVLDEADRDVWWCGRTGWICTGILETIGGVQGLWIIRGCGSTVVVEINLCFVRVALHSAGNLALDVINPRRWQSSKGKFNSGVGRNSSN